MYDYREAMKQDIRDYINDEITLTDYENRDELEEYLNEELWIVDSVTGNGSGSYTTNGCKAEHNLAGNWNLLAEAMREFCCECDAIAKGAEWADVTIRCYLLGECISIVLDEMGDELREAFESRLEPDEDE